MLKRLVSIAFVGAAVAALGYAQQSRVTLPVGKAPSNDGKQSFVNYCAPCHGVDGRGQGPVAAMLVQKPADLTLLAKNNHGVYPDAHVVSVIQFGAEMHSAHGTKDMPVWGPIFGSTDRQGTNDVHAIRVFNLSKYLKTLQAK
jgi:mono/diheme cytochrome c family protein